MRTQLALSILAFFTLLSTTSCRTSLRAGTDAGDLITVTFKLAGMNTEDKSRNDLLYALATCGSGAANGTLNPDASVSFQTRGIRKGDRCDIFIKSGSTKADNVEWFSEPGLLYRSVNTQVSSTEGRMNGIAVLQQMYTNSQPPSSKLFKMSASFKSPAALTDICTCLIGTNPSLNNNVSKVETTGGTQGKCTFVNSIATGLSKIECSKILVQCGSSVYKASWPADTFADGSNARDIVLPDLTLESGSLDDISNTTIDVVIPH